MCVCVCVCLSVQRAATSVSLEISTYIYIYIYIYLRIFVSAIEHAASFARGVIHMRCSDSFLTWEIPVGL